MEELTLKQRLEKAGIEIIPAKTSEWRRMKFKYKNKIVESPKNIFDTPQTILKEFNIVI